MPKELSGFSWRVIDQVQKLIVEMDTTDAQVIRDSRIPRNTFYVKMRGETALTTEDIDKIARALNVEPELILRRASQPDVSGGDDDAFEFSPTPPNPDDVALAAKKGRRKIDQD